MSTQLCVDLNIECIRFFYYYYFFFFFAQTWDYTCPESILKFVKFMIRVRTFEIFRMENRMYSSFKRLILKRIKGKFCLTFIISYVILYIDFVFVGKMRWKWRWLIYFSNCFENWRSCLYGGIIDAAYY